MSQDHLQQDIHDFLGAYGGGYARQTDALDLVGIGGGAMTPRQFSTAPYDINDNLVDWGSSYGNAEPSYGYGLTGYALTGYDSTGYASTSADTASVYSTSTVSTYAPTIFSKRSAGTSAGHSSRPARAPAFHRTFQQTMEEADLAIDLVAAQNQNDEGLATAVASDSHPLWCEFRFVADCNAVFRIDRSNEWLAHHEQHLRNQYPRELACWFCTHPFKPSRSTERYSNFLDRMEHIRMHVRDEYKTVDLMRPDFFMIHHMGRHGLITDAKYRAALGHNELPPALRLPNGGGSSSSSQHMQTQWNVQGSDHVHDLASERRHQRPRGSGSGSHRTHGSSRRH